MLQSVGLQRAGHDLVTEQQHTEPTAFQQRRLSYFLPMFSHNFIWDLLVQFMGAPWHKQGSLENSSYFQTKRISPQIAESQKSTRHTQTHTHTHTHIFKILKNIFLATLHDMRDLSSLTESTALALEEPSLNHWATGKVPRKYVCETEHPMIFYLPDFKNQ